MHRPEKMSRGIVCVSPLITPNLTAALKGFEDRGVLDRFVTTLAFSKNAMDDRLPQVLKGVIARRILPGFLSSKTSMKPFAEGVRTLVNRFGRNEILSDKVWEWSERRFDRWAARSWAGRSACLYGLELASVETFRAQKLHGGLCVLGQWIAHHRTSCQIFKEELERHPETVTEYDRHALRQAARINGMKDEQYASSDLIVANSDFVKDSFLRAGFDPARVVVVPTGGPTPPLVREELKIRDRVVFISAGSQSIRKGTHYLLEAWKKIGARKNAELWLIGKNTLPPAIHRDLPGKVTARPSVPRAELFELFQKASVLVLPSLCEGFAFVILEAMANGLPIITTANSGCGTFVEEGVNGWIVPIRDAGALAGRMESCLNRPDELIEMGRASRKKAAQWTGERYGEAHTDAVLNFLKTRKEWTG